MTEQSVKKGKKRDTKKAGEQGNLRKKVVPLLLTTMLKFELAEQSRNRRHAHLEAELQSFEDQEARDADDETL
ncbi:Protein CBG18719 [Caenorhabditis briggsae]|uniref:Protein CBG18719 n=1 Tax=Caenorhabditis briggsae TaxID=6238 RepID=A8XTZ4_CAEBR|nr:Protein CBG18719 [Caenorhabditis briggsae]CAP36120.1 Protein CBG18719 [Caenorhabditis briggsae]